MIGYAYKNLVHHVVAMYAGAWHARLRGDEIANTLQRLRTGTECFDATVVWACALGKRRKLHAGNARDRVRTVNQVTCVLCHACLWRAQCLP